MIMDQLPPELWPPILQNLQPADLKSCRFVSHSFSAAAATPLFHTVSIYPVKEIFDWLDILPQSVCLCVRQLRFHRIPLPIFKSFELARQDDPSQSSQAIKSAVCNHFPASKTEIFFSSYQRLTDSSLTNVAGSTTGRCGYLDIDRLRSAVDKFRGLNTLELSEIDMGRFKHPIRDREPFRSMSDEALFNISIQADKLLVALGSVIAQLSTIDLQDVTWLMLDNLDPITFTHLEDNLKNLKHFAITMPNRFHLEPLVLQGRNSLSNMGRLLNAPQNLYSLDLSCKGICKIADGCFDILTIRHSWPHLGKLRIAGVNVDGQKLVDFLKRHSASLRSLELANISLWGGERFQTSGLSWITLIRTLRESFSLTHMNFSGGLLNGGYDGWEVSSKVTPNGLKDRIEQYIVHGGQCPLPLDSARYLAEPERTRLLTRFPGDASWRYDEDYYGIFVRTW